MLRILTGDKGGKGNILYAKSHSRECALQMKKSWLCHCIQTNLITLSSLAHVGNNKYFFGRISSATADG